MAFYNYLYRRQSNPESALFCYVPTSMKWIKNIRKVAGIDPRSFVLDLY